MSGKGGVISFDLSFGEGSVINLALMMPLSSTHTLDHQGEGNTLDEMHIRRKKINLNFRMKVSLERFQSLETLDLATKKIRELTKTHKGIRHARGISCIKIIDPIYIPYASIDIRRYSRYTTEVRYADLFERSLPYKIMMRRAVKTTRYYIYKKRRVIGVTAGLFVLLSTPLLYFVKTGIESGYRELESLSHVTEVSQIQSHVLKARGYFERSRVVFVPFSWIPLDKIDLANKALLGGLAVSRALDVIARELPNDTGLVSSLPKSKDILPTYRGSALDIFTFSYLGIESPTTWIKEHTDTLVSVRTYLNQAREIYEDGDDGGQYARVFKSVGGVLGTVADSLDWYLENDLNVLSLLGDDAPKRYIIFNQNRDEIRANGGFPGSVITLTLYKGNILDYRKDDVYYFDWNLYPYKELPPPGIALLTNNYGLRDVNYYPDFGTTIEKANSFIERSGDSTLTTGIAIHQGLVEDMLEKIGPISVSGITIPFTSENFSVLMSTLVETNYGRETHAKDILFSFIDAFIHRVHETRSYMDIIESIEDYWTRGEILVASRDETTDEFLSKYRKKLPWECDESHDSCPRNWAYPVFTSVSGNKSDRYIDRKYRSTTTKILGCKYENLLTITNTHTFAKKDLDAINSYLDEVGIADKVEREKYMFIQGNGKNKAFVRLYVPLGSELALEGSDVQSETNENSTVFSFTLDTPVGGSASKTIRYTTNIPLCQNSNNEVVWYRQPGLRKVEEK